MLDSRRKRFYIDRIFQNKFLLLFVALSVLSTIGNILYLFFYLKNDLENHLYRARIVISNVNEVIIGNVLYFNLILMLVTVSLAIVFYSLVQKRIKFFVDKLKDTLAIRTGKGAFENFDIYLPKEFQDIDDVLGNFFKAVDNKLEAERDLIVALKKFLGSPDDKIKQEILEKMNNIDQGISES